MSEKTYDNIIDGGGNVTAANESGLSGDSDGDGTEFSAPLLTFAAVMTFLIMFIGIIGNFLTVAALIKCPKVRNVAAAFIISLCLADLLFCALVLPFSALRFIQGTWTHGTVLCKLIPFIQYGNIGVSLLCIAMITMNRYVMIAHHNAYSRIYKRHWIAAMIAFCWLFSYGMQLPTLLGAWGRFDFDPRLKTCSIMSDEHGHSSKTTLFITAFVIPCLIIIACYTKIFWVVHKSEQRLKQHANKQNSIPNNLRTMPPPPPPLAPPASTLPSGEQEITSHNRIAANVTSDSSSSSNSNSNSYSTDIKSPHELSTAKYLPTRVKDQREVRAKRNEWRITKMVLAIFLSFVICYLPITIVKVADKDVEHPSLHIFSYIMLYLSACINPIIYVIMNKQYRKAYKTVIMCEPSRLLGPFGKANGASTAAEKWKDIGLSNNHSRTQVSQISAGAAQAQAQAQALAQAHAQSQTKLPLSQQQQQQSKNNRSSTRPQSMIALELLSTTKSETKSPMQLSPSSPPPPPPPPSVTGAVNRNVMNNNNMTVQSNARLMLLKSNSSSSSNNNSNNSNSGNSIYREMSGNAPLLTHRITMVGDDIILEEEETVATSCNDALTTRPTVSTSTQVTTAAAAATTTTPSNNSNVTYMNVAAPKKIQYYGPNINAIPANGSGTNAVTGLSVGGVSKIVGNIDDKVTTAKLKI